MSTWNRDFRSDDFNEEVFSQILHRMENGEAVTAICRDQSLPEYSVFASWVNSSPERFHRYARARQIQADYYADETVEIADNETNMIRARNRMDARRWFASKVAPKKYGDRIQNEINAHISQTVKVDLRNLDAESRRKLKRALMEQMSLEPSKQIESTDHTLIGVK